MTNPSLHRCGKCCQWLPRDHFARMTAGKQGIQAYCRTCAAAYWREWAAKRADPSTTTSLQGTTKGHQ